SLVVGVEPAGALPDAPDVLYDADAPAQVAHVDRVRLPLARDAVPQGPDLHHAVHVYGVVLAVEGARGVGGVGRHPADFLAIDLLAALAVAHGQLARARPAVGEEAVRPITLVHLPVDGRHLLGEVRAEHAGLEEPGALAVPAR